MSKATIFFVFIIHNHYNLWRITNESKLKSLSLSETCARVIYQKDPYTHGSPLSLNVFQLNIFNILCFMYKCKKNLNPPVFRKIFTHRTKTKYVLRNENSIQEPLCRTYFRQYCISNREPYRWNKIIISKNLTFKDSDSLQAFKRELKRFLFSVELNDLEILK